MPVMDWEVVRDEATRYLQGLLRIDTTNPPGNERAAAECLAEILAREGIAPRLIEPVPRRTSLLARLPGRGERGPILLQGHTDVVPADPAEWSHPPFSGDLADGCLWGRGALDMTGTVVMQFMALLLVKRTDLRPSGDVIFAALADEEAGGGLGAGWLVDHVPELVRAVVAPEDVVALVRAAGLRGAYFPVHLKWESARGQPAPRYLVVNAEEGEPGVFKDRHLMEGDPHALIEGTLIAAYAVGAERAFIYINGQAELSAERVMKALQDARAAGLVGEHVLGSDFSCAIEVYRGAGGYVCGEESVILSSIEGERAVPRLRPPFPTESGASGASTSS